jgi:hypothetical protein
MTVWLRFKIEGRPTEVLAYYIFRCWVIFNPTIDVVSYYIDF